MSNHTDDPKASFLSAFITWLDVWEFYRHDTGVLTQETLSALRLSAQSLLALVKYCVSELHFKYILLGKVQTDPLESRFGQYRQMAGGQYHISVRQLCETEGRIRLQNALPRMSNDDLRGIEEMDSVRDAGTSFSVHVSDADLDELRAQMPVIGYVGGYCAHAAMKVLKCESCQRQLVVTGNTAETGEDTHSLIAQLDRGGLKFPSALVIAVVMYTEVVVRKLMTESTSTQFLHGPNQKNVVRQLTLDSLPRLEDIDTCENGHTYELLITLSFSLNPAFRHCMERRAAGQAGYAAYMRDLLKSSDRRAGQGRGLVHGDGDAVRASGTAAVSFPGRARSLPSAADTILHVRCNVIALCCDLPCASPSPSDKLNEVPSTASESLGITIVQMGTFKENVIAVLLDESSGLRSDCARRGQRIARPPYHLRARKQPTAPQNGQRDSRAHSSTAMAMHVDSNGQSSKPVHGTEVYTAVRKKMPRLWKQWKPLRLRRTSGIQQRPSWFLHAGLSDIQDDTSPHDSTEKIKSQITSWKARAKGHFLWCTASQK
ncbi:hypothetical protein HPB51_008379 [Rhipicephalus microplus]|uniref:Transposable element n=1 Tax=Rhipicephalus microplus TaxID=6941 RepID=A0A9J6DU77_RHIMP|nr:hypothetical protein HPB51_008379 [Rhipicephalus microplus]